MLSIFYF